MKTLSIDIETRSGYDLSKCGAYKYVESPDYDILLFGYSSSAPAALVNPSPHRQPFRFPRLYCHACPVCDMIKHPKDPQILQEKRLHRC